MAKPNLPNPFSSRAVRAINLNEPSNLGDLNNITEPGKTHKPNLLKHSIAASLAAAILLAWVPSAPVFAADTLADAKLSIRTKQFETARQQLTQLARAGDIEAQYLLGSLYRSGTGIKRDYAKSYYWFNESASEHRDAAYQLASLYETGKGTSKNMQQATAWYQQAATQGHKKAQRRLDKLQAQESAFASGPTDSEQVLRLIRNNDVPALKRTFANGKGANVINQIGKSGQTPLSAAIERRNLEAVSALLDAGASPDRKNSLGETPLTLAASLGAQKIAQALMKNGANINLQNKLQNTPLHVAVDRGSVTLAKALLAKGANPNITNNKSFTALDYAGDDAMRSALAKYDAKAGKFSDFTAPQSELSDEALAQNIVRQSEILAGKDNPFKGWPALNVAAWRGQQKQVEVLLKQASSKNSALDIDSLDLSELTPLARASWQGHDEIVALLLDAGANVNHVASNGDTPLTLAVSGNHERIAERLVDAGANFDGIMGGTAQAEPLLNIASRKDFTALALKFSRKVNEPDFKHNGNTPLMWAAHHGQAILVKALLKRKVNVNAKDNTGRTPLLIAAQNDDLAVITLLIKAGASPAIEDVQGMTPAAVAAKKGNSQILAALLTSEDLANRANTQGNTPLMLAAQGGHAAVVQQLINAGADTEQRNNNSFTALMLAAQGGHSSAVDALLSGKANAKRRSREGKSAADMAEEAGHTQLAEHLKKSRRSLF